MPARMLWRVVDLEQTRPSVVRYCLAWMVTRATAMFTPAECQALAKEKLAEAERDPQHRKRLQKVAVAWLILANQLIRAEGASAGIMSSFSRAGLSSPPSTTLADFF